MPAPLFKRFAANDAGRDFVVGDVHGYFYLLEALLAHVGFDEARDRVFSVGDLVDRGPESERVSEFLVKPWFHAIRGNHEDMLLQGADGPDPERPAMVREILLWQENGGDWWHEVDHDEQLRIYAAVEQLPMAIEVELAGGGVAGLVHAQVIDRDWATTRAWITGDMNPDGWPLVRTTLIWGRGDARGVYELLRGHAERVPADLSVSGIDLVYLGHTPMPAPVSVANTRWLDAGAAQGRGLAVAELGDSVAADVRGAQSVGMPSILVDRRGVKPGAIPSLQPLLEMLPGL